MSFIVLVSSSIHPLIRAGTDVMHSLPTVGIMALITWYNNDYCAINFFLKILYRRSKWKAMSNSVYTSKKNVAGEKLLSV